jgi:hypothetical protein
MEKSLGDKDDVLYFMRNVNMPIVLEDIHGWCHKIFEYFEDVVEYYMLSYVCTEMEVVICYDIENDIEKYLYIHYVEIVCHVGKICQKIFWWCWWNIFKNIIFCSFSQSKVHEITFPILV